MNPARGNCPRTTLTRGRQARFFYQIKTRGADLGHTLAHACAIVTARPHSCTTARPHDRTTARPHVRTTARPTRHVAAFAAFARAFLLKTTNINGKRERQLCLTAFRKRHHPEVVGRAPHAWRNRGPGNWVPKHAALEFRGRAGHASSRPKLHRQRRRGLRAQGSDVRRSRCCCMSPRAEPILLCALLPDLSPVY